MSEYKVKFEVFEGPLDLLLYLVRKEEVEIYDVDLTKLATQFIEYIEVMRTMDLDVAGEFLVMAATLMYIKSRELLPKDLQVAATEEDDEEDPRWELIRQLVEYKKFKDAAAQLQRREFEMDLIYPRQPGKIEFDADQPAPRMEASIFDLLNAVNSILRRVNQRDESRDIFEERWSVSEKMEQLATAIQIQSSLKFSELFEDARNRSEVVCTFLALLELIRLKQLLCVQGEDFGEIEITRSSGHLTLSRPEEPSAETPVREISPTESTDPNPELN